MPIDPELKDELKKIKESIYNLRKIAFQQSRKETWVNAYIIKRFTIFKTNALLRHARLNKLIVERRLPEKTVEYLWESIHQDWKVLPHKSLMPKGTAEQVIAKTREEFLDFAREVREHMEQLALKRALKRNGLGS